MHLHSHKSDHNYDLLSEANLSSAQRAGKTIWYLPLYMTFCLKRDCEQALDGIRVSPPVFGDAIA